VIGGLADLQLLGHLRNLAALSEQPVGLSKLADDLLGGVAASLHRVLLPIGAIGLSLVHHPDCDLRSAGRAARCLSGDGQGLVPH
jgi:hypothetical protein